MRIFAALLAVCWPCSSSRRWPEEAPLLAERVAAGKLPPEAERLPKEPRVMTIDEATRRTSASAAARSGR